MKRFDLTTAIRQVAITISVWVGYMYTGSGLLMALAVIATILAILWLILEIRRVAE